MPLGHALSAHFHRFSFHCDRQPSILSRASYNLRHTPTMSDEKAETTEEPKTEPKTENSEQPKEEESTATFTPVVKLEEVEVKSGEEDEEVIYLKRAKLFINGETLLDKGTGKKTWRERGVGEVRILRHREHERFRLLMRQEKTMKVIANFAADPRIVMIPNVGSDKSWVFNAFDFSDGELVETTFALRFGNADIAKEFKEKFEESQKEMERILAGEDKPGEDDGKAGDEAAEALEKLTTKGEETSEE